MQIIQVRDDHGFGQGGGRKEGEEKVDSKHSLVKSLQDFLTC